MTKRPDPQATALREALVDQLAYLIDEIEALKALAERIPIAVQEGHPLDREPSLKELYGQFVAFDEDVYLPRLRRMVSDRAPSFDPLEEEALLHKEAWNSLALDHILDRVQRARSQLVSFLQPLPAEAWRCRAQLDGHQVDLYSMIHQIIQQDTDRLRTIGHRLHESHLTSRPQDLPK